MHCTKRSNATGREDLAMKQVPMALTDAGKLGCRRSEKTVV